MILLMAKTVLYHKDESSCSPVTVRPIDTHGINNAQWLIPDVIIKKQYFLLVKFYRKQILGTLDLREKVHALCENVNPLVS